jgi:AAHS family 4-hydroxybenzoate transporter-like MFS transporter
MSKTVDVAALLDDNAWSSYQKLLTALAAVAVMFDGFDIQILGFAIPSLTREWGVARGDFGPVLALGLAGMAVGGPLAGYCGDRFGRRTALISCATLFGLATIATALVHGFLGLAFLRFLTGMGTGGALPTASTLTAEFAPLRRRATAVKLTLICVSLGGMLGGLLAAWILPRFGWRGLYLAGGALPLVYVAALWAAMPESPRFLARVPARWAELIRFFTRIGCTVPARARFDDRAESAKAKRAFGPRVVRPLARPRHCGSVDRVLLLHGLDLSHFRLASGHAHFAGSRSHRRQLGACRL